VRSGETVADAGEGGGDAVLRSRRVVGSGY